MKNTNRNESVRDRGRNIALGAAMGLVLGGAIDMVTGDTGWGLAIGILGGAAAGYWVRFPGPVMEYPGYIIRRIMHSAVLLLVGLFLSQWLLGQDLAQPYQLIAAVLPAIPGVLLAYAIGSAIAQLDELQRRIQLEGIGIGFGMALVISMTYALLLEVGVPQVSWMLVPLLMLVCWMVGKLWTMWKYR